MNVSRAFLAGMFLTPMLMFAQATPPTGWKGFSIGPAERTTITPTSITSEGISLKQLLSIAYETPQSRIFGPEWLDTERRSITAIPEQADKEKFKALLRTMLAEHFKVVTRNVKRRLPVYIMKRLDKSPLNLMTSQTEGTCRADQGLFAGQGTIESLAVCFEWLLNRPVVEETGIGGRFRFEILYSGTPAVLLTAIRQLGLQLIPAERELEVLMVEVRE